MEKLLRHYKTIVMVLFMFSLGWVSVSQAQETNGSLRGKISDKQQQGLAGVSVTAVHVPTGFKYATTTDKEGRYEFNNIRVGEGYKIEAKLIGHATVIKENIIIRLGEPYSLIFELDEQVQQMKEINISGSRIKTNKANKYGAGTNINANQLNNLPKINRSITDITKLTPQGSRDNSFAGTNFRYNNVTIDGAVNNDAIGFSPSLGGQTGTSGMMGSSTRTNPISLDAIEDMQVYLAPYDVKIGNFTGGSINAVTRSGTNHFSGSVYAFGRNAAITGKDKVGSSGTMNTSFYDFQTGFRAGFPIIKDKLFFFTNEEITERRDPTLLNVGTAQIDPVLSAADAAKINATTQERYGAMFDAGTAGVFNVWSKSSKFFNRLDWNINQALQLAVRNNTILSKATHMDRDQQDFRFSSMGFEQKSRQSSTVAELKARINSGLNGNLIVGYTQLVDGRTPFSDPSLPQVQIMGRAPGTTIYLGTDREASIFDMKQKTWEITANINWRKGRHNLLLGTHNELYKIDYGFVNAWNARVDYLSIEDFVANNPIRVRGSYNYTNNSRDYILANPSASFNVNMYSIYVQDEISVSDHFTITPGLRVDYTSLPDKPTTSEKLSNIFTDPHYGKTYLYNPLQRTNGSFMKRGQLSPRVGFRYVMSDDYSLILRGGAGLFTGRIPFAWLAYAYYNTGNSYGAFDQRADQQPFTPGSDAIKPSPNGIGGFIGQNGVVVNDPNSGKTQVDLIDNNFVLPQVFRGSIGLDYEMANDWKLTVEGMYTKNIRDVLFQQLNTADNPSWYSYDEAKQQPVYKGTVDPRFSNIYLLSNTNKGYRYSITGTLNKTIDRIFNGSVSYTYGKSKDLANGVRNSMESNWQLNQALVPNNPVLAYSNFDIRHRIVANFNYTKAWKKAGKTDISLLFTAQSGSPFTYGIVNNSIQGLPQQVSLVYIPNREEAIHFFRDAGAKSAEAQAAAFNNLIDQNKYLSGKRGQFTERNAARTPWNVQADLHIAQQIFTNKKHTQTITITFDVLNLTNLINKNWGIQYFSPSTFNSTASVGLTPVLFPAQQNRGGYPAYTFTNPGSPYGIDYFSSRVQSQLGARYSF